MRYANYISAGLVMAVTALCVPGFAQDRSSDLSWADKKFMMSAARGGITEVQLGELAARRGTRRSVREFGQKMVDDHSNANDRLKDIAANKGVSLPTEPDWKGREAIARLERLHGAAFDAAYVRHMRMDHQEDIDVFTRESENGRDRELRRFAARTLPLIKEHYRLINRMSEVRAAWRQ